MSAPRWPDVYSGLLALVRTLPAATAFEVFDGQPISNDVPPNYVVIGFVTDDGAGAYAQERDPSGFATVESGEIRCHVVANAGDADPGITRTAAFALVADWQAAVEADQTLGGAIPSGSVVNLSSQVMAVQNSQGSATSLLVTVAYATTTFFNP